MNINWTLVFGFFCISSNRVYLLIVLNRKINVIIYSILIFFPLNFFQIVYIKAPNL